MNAPSKVPAGVLAMVGETARRQREAENRCLDLLAAEGFQQVHLPVLEFAGDEPGSGYRFVDRAGHLIALRTDFTPLAARVLAPCLEPDAPPLHVCYAGEVIRPQPARLRRLPELYQLGFESYGVRDGATRALALTLELLRLTGVEPVACHLAAGVSGLAEKVLGRLCGGPPADELVELLRVADVDALGDALELSPGRRGALAAAVLGEPAAGWAGRLGVAGEVGRVEPLLAAARGAGLDASFELAPRLAGDYYRGVVFSLWGRHTRAVLAGGGEYVVTGVHGEVPAAGACLALGIALEEASC